MWIIPSTIGNRMIGNEPIYVYTGQGKVFQNHKVGGTGALPSAEQTKGRGQKQIVKMRRKM